MGLAVNTGHERSHAYRKDPASAYHPLAIVLFLLIMAGVMYSIIRSNGDDRRAPAPTPIYENVNRISP